MAFKKQTATTTPAADPEALYRQLNRGPGSPAALWVHQAEVLRSWSRTYQHSKDVAVELPTGAGKTLVGALVAEFRREAGQRTVYVCPTRQLARQTFDKLCSYGIPAVLLIGKVNQWGAADRVRYTSGSAIAVTVYSHIFNSNSAFADVQYMVLDDTHAAEGAVAGPWSITVPRTSSAYQDLISILEFAFDPLVVTRLRTDVTDPQYQSQVYLASPIGVAHAAAELERVVVNATQSGALDNSAIYAYRLMAGHLDRCMVYVSYNSLLIRPFITPTATLPAFDGPTQRLYMSATLGSGGELERSFGRSKIDRIPAPDGWEKQGTGRRFFCFPELTRDLSGNPEAVAIWIQERIGDSGRAVVLAPDGRTADSFTSQRLPAGLAIFHAIDVEDDLTTFTAQPSAALVLANRDDGVDLPDDDCRLVVVQGLPARGDLQERFLHGSLGALEVLQERVRARIVQGAGRATRNAGDHAAVLVLGDDLTSFCTRADVRAALHPEVHAEIDFGLNNSLDTTSAELSENLAIFFKHDREWREVEAEIITQRDGLTRVEPPGARELAAAAGDEVAACLALWQGDLEKALEHARRILDALRGGKAPQRYAALWNYIAACWAAQLADRTGEPAYRTASRNFYSAARAAGRGTTWLSHLAAPADQTTAAEPGVATDPLDLAAAANVAAALPNLGKASRFDSDVSTARSDLLALVSGPYEQALVYLGKLLGAAPSTGDGGATAAPDATWIFSSLLWVACEAKSEADPRGELGANDVRQAGGHLRYIADQRDEPIPGGSSSLLITNQERVHPSAISVAEDHVFIVRTTIILEIFDAVVRAWRKMRALGAGVGAEQVLEALIAEGANPSSWLGRVIARPIKAARE